MSRTHPGQILAALILILLGLITLLSNLGLVIFNWNLLWPVILVLFGAWLVWRALQPSPFGDGSSSWGIGDYRPDLAGKEIGQARFSHGMGDVDLDFSSAIIPDGTTAVRASHGLGDLTIILPREVPVLVNASAGLGNVFVLGKRSEGFTPQVSFQSDDYAGATRKLNIEASVGLGDVKVLRAG
ncbi:MAG: cell wall-active antibiotics response protein LiaF [Acidobacteriota bacterium]